MIVGRLLRRIVWSAAVVCIPAGVRANDTQLVAAHGTTGWFVLSAPEIGSTVYELSADSPPGTMRRAFTLATRPSAITAEDDRLILVYAPIEHTDGSGSMRQVRVVRFSQEGAMRLYLPPEPLAPLPGNGVLAGISSSSTALRALLAGEDDSNEIWQLLQLQGNEWSAEPLPAGAKRSINLHLLTLKSHAVLVSIDSDATRLWKSDASRAPGSWAAPVTLAAVSQDSNLFAVQNQLLTARSRNAVQEIALLRGSSTWPVASLKPRGPDQWIVPVGEHLASIWSDGGVAPALSCAVLSIDGTTIYDGPVQIIGPVGAREFELLAVLLGSIALSVGVFVLRPSSASQFAINMPEHHALAEPWRRALAGAIDTGIALLLASQVWSVPIGEMLDPTTVSFDRVGIWPLVLAAGVMIALSTLGEAMFGRTIGKALVGCKTISSAGGKPTVVQALARNTIKTLCPPLGVLSVMTTPPQSSPASFKTVVVIHIEDTGDPD